MSKSAADHLKDARFYLSDAMEVKDSKGGIVLSLGLAAGHLTAAAACVPERVHGERIDREGILRAIKQAAEDLIALTGATAGRRTAKRQRLAKAYHKDAANNINLAREAITTPGTIQWS